MKKATKQPKDEEAMMQTNFIKGLKVLITQGIYTGKVWEVFDEDGFSGWLFVIIDNCFLETFPLSFLQSIENYGKTGTE